MIMVNHTRALQVASMLLLLAGCASTRTAPLAPASVPAQATGTQAVTLQAIGPQAAASPAASSTVSGSPAAGSSAPAAPAAPSIKAGTSVVSSDGFLGPDARLLPDIQAYAQEVAQTRGIPLSHVEALLKSAQYDAAASRLMAPSPTRIRRSWVTYRNRFVEPVRINAGVKFWEENQSTLDRSAAEYGVPPSIIVAIIGVETIYGRNTGNFRVLDALATLGFRYPDASKPERSQMFRDQLADLIQLDYEKKLDATQIQGSFAGAMGLPQFMPGSLMRYAADGDRDGRIDLLYSTEDAIASVARFLRLHGWTPGLPVFAPATLPRDPQSLVVGGLQPTHDWADLQAAGARLRAGPPTQQLTSADPAAPGAAPAWMHHKLGIVNLPDEPRNTIEYRTGTPNFFAITHYNRSYFYAASVADLAQALAAKMGYGGPNPP
jgi:membrane-bound lytic murein transglycosylase B